MITITEQILRSICPSAPADVSKYIEPLNEAMAKYGINQTVNRVAFFLAQCAHESGQFRYVAEIASGAAYEGRKDLGNTVPNDGKRYKGRGILQITGRFNYDKVGKAMGVDLINNPQLLETPQYATMSAAWFFDSIKGNGLADLPSTWRSQTKGYSPFEYLSYRINGGMNGYVDRLQFLNKALSVLK